MAWPGWLNVVNIVAGIWLIISPFVLGFTTNTAAMWNAIILGIIVLVIAAVSAYGGVGTRARV